MTREEIDADARNKFKLRLFVDGALVRTVTDFLKSDGTKASIYYEGNDKYGMGWSINISYWRGPELDATPDIHGKYPYRSYFSVTNSHASTGHSRYFVISAYPRLRQIIRRLAADDYDFIAESPDEVAVAGQPYLVAVEQSPVVLVPSYAIPAGATTRNPTTADLTSRAGKFIIDGTRADMELTSGFRAQSNRVSMDSSELDNYPGGLDLHIRRAYKQLIYSPRSSLLVHGSSSLLTDL